MSINDSYLYDNDNTLKRLCCSVFAMEILVLYTFDYVYPTYPFPGYQGNGVTCTWVGVCQDNNGGCYPLAACTESQGTSLFGF